MSLKFYGHPFSLYCQKVLVALYEYDLPFEWRLLAGDTPDANAEFAARWPLKHMPMIVDGERTVVESTIIVEYLGLRRPANARLLPADAGLALDVRMMDRFFDCYVSTPLQKIVFDALRPQAERDPRGVADARRMLGTSYAWLERAFEGRDWAAGDVFSLADCSAAPSLFYADWTHPIDASLQRVIAYRKRLLARPSFARALDEARPYRHLFPLGAPDRD
ncbi:glutathione S-transferase [Burkholderia savannae]|uniref:glutathione S-transferase family protein n=1 Tax=Burkholderia savannae TaxID=1637837 RepID=UPI00076435F6|nr:glutathione S-transferase family protein [Burkholderia savannae]KWZ47279.1 glutathione S-transferase [Burkholderia savannae]